MPAGGPAKSGTALASFCLSKGYQVQLIDAPGETPWTISTFQDDIFLRGMTVKEIVGSIDSDAEIIGISNLFSFAYPAVRKLSEALSKAFPKSAIVLGGPHPTHMSKEVLAHGSADFVIRGEGEFPILDLCRHVVGEIPIDEVRLVS